MIQALVDDIVNACASMPESSPRRRLIEQLRQAIIRNESFLHTSPTAIFQCCWNFGSFDDDDLQVHAYRSFSPEHIEELRRMRLMVLPFKSLSSTESENNRFGSAFAAQLRIWREEKRSTQVSFPWVRALRPEDTATGAVTAAVIRDHNAGVECVCISADGRTIISASKDNTIRVHDRELRLKSRCIPHPGDRVASMVLFPDNERIAVASWAGDECKVYDLSSGDLIVSMPLSPAVPLSVAVSPDGHTVAVGCDDGAIHIFNSTENKLIKVLVGHNGGVMAVDFSPTGFLLLSGAREKKSIRIWNTNDWSLAHIIEPNSIGRPYRNWEAECIACSPVGDVFATGHVDGSVRLWRIGSFEYISSFAGLTWPVLSLSFSGDGRRLIASGHSGECLIWDVTTQAIVKAPTGQVGHVWSAKMSHDGGWCVIASEDATVRIITLDYSSGEDYENHSGGLSSICVSSHGNKFLTSGLDGVVRVWSTLIGVTTTRFIASNAIYSACATSDFRFMYLYTSDGRLETRIVDTGEVVWGVTVNIVPTPGSIALSPDNSLLALATTHQVRFFYVSDNAIALTELEFNIGSLHDDLFNTMFNELADALPTALCFSQDGTLLACGYSTGLVKLFDLSRNGEEIRFTGLDKKIIDLTFGYLFADMLIVSTEAGTAYWLLTVPNTPQLDHRLCDIQNYPRCLAGEGLHLVSVNGDVRLEENWQIAASYPEKAQRIKRIGSSDRWVVSDGIRINVLVSEKD